MEDRAQETGEELDSLEQRVPMTRRRVLALGGASLVAAFFSNEALGQRSRHAVRKPIAGMKPVYLPEGKDAVSHSVAENLFWLEQEAEHAKFFQLLMSGPEHAGLRRTAREFELSFQDQRNSARRSSLGRDNYVRYNRSSQNLVKSFLDFKHQNMEAQLAGRLNSLVWPTFFEHTILEAQHFSDRLGQLSKGEVAMDLQPAVEFWTRIMGDHGEFVAHLLDPREKALIDKANRLAGKAIDLNQQNRAGARISMSTLEAAAAEIIDFKVAAERGIQSGAIASIIHPLLADHVRREGVKFQDDLRAVRV